MDKCLWVGAGYPVFVVGFAALWKYIPKKDRQIRECQDNLIKEKEWHVRELEEFKKMVERRARHGRLEDSP